MACFVVVESNSIWLVTFPNGTPQPIILLASQRDVLGGRCRHQFRNDLAEDWVSKKLCAAPASAMWGR